MTDTTFYGLASWEADRDPGSPVCLVSTFCGEASDHGLGLLLYPVDDGDGGVEIRGVEVTRDSEVIARAGWLPAEVIEEDRLT